jgi:hypothetical protein
VIRCFGGRSSLSHLCQRYIAAYARHGRQRCDIVSMIRTGGLLQSEIAGRERIRPPQRTHRDVVECPRPDTADLFQIFEPRASLKVHLARDVAKCLRARLRDAARRNFTGVASPSAAALSGQCVKPAGNSAAGSAKRATIRPPACWPLPPSPAAPESRAPPIQTDRTCPGPANPVVARP